MLKANRELQIEMERINGYLTLAMLFRRKRHFLNSHVLHLTFNLVGTLEVIRKHDSNNEIQQVRAFKGKFFCFKNKLFFSFYLLLNFVNKIFFIDLLCDQIDLWAQNDLLKSLLEHFNELLFESSHHHSASQEIKQKNVKILRELGKID